MSEFKITSDKNSICVDFGKSVYFIENTTASTELLKKLNGIITAAQAEIAELKELIKREVVPDIKDAEIARLKEENEQLENAAENKGTQALRYLRENHKLQSALEVAVEGLEQAKVDMEEDVFNAFHIKQTLDKIKQIRATNDAKRHMELSKVLDENGDR